MRFDPPNPCTRKARWPELQYRAHIALPRSRNNVRPFDSEDIKDYPTSLPAERVRRPPVGEPLSMDRLTARRSTLQSMHYILADLDTNTILMQNRILGI
jgi:hypothetical protein